MKRQGGYCLSDIQKLAEQCQRQLDQLKQDQLIAKELVFAELCRAVKRKFPTLPFSADKITYGRSVWTISTSVPHVRMELGQQAIAATLYSKDNCEIATICYDPDMYATIYQMRDLDFKSVNDNWSDIRALTKFDRADKLYDFLMETYKSYTTTRILTARREICLFLLCCPKILPLDVTGIIFEKIKK